MKRNAIRWSVVAAASLLAFGCGMITVPPLEEFAIQLSVRDAANNGGNDHFYFLPPLVPDPGSYGGTFDATLSPVVEIVELTDPVAGETAAEPLVVFTSEGTGSERIRVNAVDEHYIVNWHIKNFEITSPTQRIRVLLEGVELGFADVYLGEAGSDRAPAELGDFISVKDGRTLPIKFRIEEGILVDDQAPTAVLDLNDEQGRPVADGRIPYGSGFILSGKRSVDIGGEIVEWRFTRLSGTGGELPEPNTGCCTLSGMTVGETIYNPSSSLTIQLPNDKFDVGEHIIELQVVDGSGNVSLPVQIVVIVVDTQAPTAVLDLNDEQGRPVADGIIQYGSGFILSGKRSVDVGGGTISRYTWTIDGGTSIVTTEPSLSVTDSLAIGEHTISLVVQDNSGNISSPAVVALQVVAGDG